MRRLHHKIMLITALALLLFFAGPSAAAQSDKEMVTLKITPDTVRVGDEITLEIFIKHQRDFSLYLPDTIAIEPFEILDTKIVNLKEKGGDFSKAVFKMAIYKVGVFAIPNINLLLKSADKRVEIKTPTRQLEVISTLTGTADRLLDIHPPLDIRQSYLHFLIWVWAVSFVLAVAAVIYHKKRRAILTPVAVPKKKEDPNKVALELLTRIFSSKQLSKMTDKEICENIAFTVKYFLKEKFEFASMEMTSHELIDYLSAHELAEDYMNILYKLMMVCDLVKFAGRTIADVEPRHSIHDLKENALFLVQGV